ncbi:MAG: DUF481 domain-containing protein [Hahellaceae bacterium]|nr:DUF481 domain-containing protein [Hahellaceae bacterium]
MSALFPFFSQNRFRLRTGVLTLLSLTTGQALADTVWLKNNDRLTGEIRYLEANALVIKTGALGTAVIKWSSIRSFESTQPLEVERRGVEGITLTTLYQGEEGTVTTASGEVIPLKSIHSLARPNAWLDSWTWDGDLDFDLDIKNGDETQQIEVDLDTTLEKQRWRHRAESEFDYETRRGQKSEDTSDHSVTSDYFFTDQWFVRAEGGKGRNRLNNNEKYWVYGGGVGHRFFRTAKRSLEATGEITRFRYSWETTDNATDPLLLRFNSMSLTLKYEEEMQWLPITFKAEGVYFRPYSIPLDQIIDAEVSVRYKFNHWVGLTFKTEWDRTDADDIKTQDVRTLLGLGVSW